MRLLAGTAVSIMPLVLLFWYVRHRRLAIAARLANRPQLDSMAFARHYFGDSARRTKLAATLRDMLAEHLPFPVDGLLPEDRLFADLWMHQWDNHAYRGFLWEVEAIYSVRLPKGSLTSGTTFGEFVNKVDQGAPDDRIDLGMWLLNHLLSGRA